ncbi:MAG: cytochrome c3 family protein [Acidimicrobiales bacterium]|nr:cytochrome c3 family protein [Acidimicrobiales bacterium]
MSVAHTSSGSRFVSGWASCLTLGLVLLTTSCDGDDGQRGPQGPPGGGDPTSTVVEQGDDPPGMVLEILGLAGGTGAGGSFRVGDHVALTYTLEKTDGTAWDVTEMNYGRAMISGPTFNYQRVLPEVSDVAGDGVSVENADGSYTYTFADPLPAVYAAPINDTASFDENDGELTGQALLGGTYTLGLYFGWNYTVDGVSARDADNATLDFLIGAGPLEARAVVGMENCNQCHESLRIHSGGIRRDIKLCVLCHTSGSEDRNDPAVAGGTPDVTVDFKVMIHKIHNGSHLPSVLGVSTNPDGSRNYTATPKPYLINTTSHDYSGVAFPVWPSLNIAMPRDFGYTALSSGEKSLEDTIRMGVVACDKCHGDPDGAGPLSAPAQGDLYMAEPSEGACGACHDDIVWGTDYIANQQLMSGAANNTNCKLCHEPSGDSLAVLDAHTHPLVDSSFNPGLNFAITAVAEAGTNDDDGTLDPGEKAAITFTMTDDEGNDAAATVATSYSVIVSGPTNNNNLLLNASIPSGALTGAQPYTVNLPESRVLEFIGDATGAGGDTLSTSRSPLWDMTGATTTVYARSATAGGSTVTSEDSLAPQNYVDVASTTNFARDDYVVIDDDVAGLEEYSRITLVDGNRLWLGTLLSAHDAGATVDEVTLTSKTLTTHYTVNAALGEITTVSGFGAGQAVVVSYTSDFVMPAVYPLPINGSPDIDETLGKWTGKSIVGGTYTVAIYGAPTLSLALQGESNSYRGTSASGTADFLVDDATTIEPYGLTAGAATCNACHSDIYFHGGGRRGWDSCLACHGTAGSEDRARYTAANAPETTGLSINFRAMLHKIHMGEELTNASSYTIVGFGSAAYPNNFTPHTYEEVVFPAMPGAAANCAVCHGSANTAWKSPAERDHPTEQTRPVRAWRAVCGECHDSNAMQAHIEVQTSASGYESCEVCHGTSGEWSVERVHRRY